MLYSLLVCIFYTSAVYFFVEGLNEHVILQVVKHHKYFVACFDIEVIYLCNMDMPSVVM